MSNLGPYQWFTTASKKLGGPIQFVLLAALGGYILFRGIEAGGKYVYKLVKKNKDLSDGEILNASKWIVKVEGTSNEGIHFNIGDEFYILGNDNDAILIDKIGDSNSPYYISKNFFDFITKT